jgi:hypothetical protein
MQRNIRKKRPAKRPLKRTILTSTVEVTPIPSKDVDTHFRINSSGSVGPLRTLSSCTVITKEDTPEGESYIIFKKRENGTWELVITSNALYELDNLSSIGIVHDVKVTNL